MKTIKNLMECYLMPWINPSILICIHLLTATGCEEFVQTDPPKNEIISESVFTNDATATAAIRGIYSLMMTNQSFTNGEIERYTGLSSDELTNYSSNQFQLEFFTNSLGSQNSNVENIFWREAYKYINNANGILEGLSKFDKIPAAKREQLEGEAKFIRAFCHFYLVNLFGDIPYISSTDYRLNASVKRDPESHVYERMIEDLVEAQHSLPNDFTTSNNERIQPNKGAATALLARIYLYSGQWTKAEEQASDLIEDTGNYSLENDLNLVFLANSREAIWQLKP